MVIAIVREIPPLSLEARPTSFLREPERSQLGVQLVGTAVDQGSMFEQPRPENVGSVKDDHGHFQQQIDTCDAALRRLAGLVPQPHDAIEALLLAKATAEQRLAALSQSPRSG